MTPIREMRFSTFLATLLIFFCASTAFARPYALQWDPSNDGVTTGYIVFYGTASNTYQPVNGTDVDNVTTFQIDLTPGTTYYFRVRGYNSSGTPGPLSDELTFVVPANATVQASPTTVAPSGTVTTTVSNGPGDPQDWLGLYAAGAPNASFLQKKYLNGLATPPASGVTGATVDFVMPSSAGSYEVRFFHDDSLTSLFGTSPTITVTAAAVISTPANGNSSFDTTNNIQWNSVPTAEAYYLWAGTTPGSQNLINTGEILATQVSATSLPAATLIYATLWTRFNGTWYQTTSSFTTSAQANWIYPTASAIGVTAQAFSWTSVPGATAYYLWVGTTPNSANLVDTGEIAQTQYTPTELPSGATLYATIWTKVNSVWQGRQISFVTSPAATWVYPGVHTSAVLLTTPLEWAAVPGAQAYFLWVGSSPRTSNLVNTGEIQQVQYLASSLPAATTVYATIWTRHNGVWYPKDKTFTTAPVTTWVTPASSGTTLPSGDLLQWTPVSGADAYYLWVGTALDGQDVGDSGEIQVAQASTAGMLTGQVLYATAWVRHTGVWYPTRTTFTLVPMVATWVSPSGPTLPAGHQLEWTTVAGAQAYYLWIGTSPMTQNIVNSGEILATTYPSTSLPSGTQLYATIWTKYNGIWRNSTAAFTIP